MGLMGYLLDTDTCIQALKTLNPGLIMKLEMHEGQLSTSAIVLHELYYGAAGYAHPKQRHFLIDQLASRLSILPFDRATAAHAGELRHTLRKSGQPIGPYDVLIAATAMALKLVLVTGNVREFSRIKNLRFENWIS